MAISITQNIVSEGSITGFVIGTLSSDTLGAGITWQILNDPTGGALSIVGDQLVVSDGTLIDFETLSTLNLQIEGNDGALIDTDTVSISVTDLNEIFGTPADDTINGTVNGDIIEGLDGGDTIDAGDGNDIIRTGTGTNFVTGGAGDDQIIGGTRNWFEDFDTADYSTSTGPITVTVDQISTVVGNASVGTDTLSFIDRYFGSSSADIFNIASGWVGKYGDDWVEIQGGDGDDVINGNGTTRISYFDATEGVTVDFGAGTAGTTSGNNGLVGNDTFSGVYSVRGSVHDDVLIGSDGSQATYGFEEFRGMQGNDDIQGGAGIDRADYNNSTNGIVADLSTGAIGEGTVQDGFGFTDTLTGIENIRGSQNDDSITGDDGANQLRGRAGNDMLFGNGGSDDLRGEDGHDVMDGGAGDDVLRGGFGSNTYIGGAGNDTFQGSTGTTINDYDTADYRTATGAITVNVFGDSNNGFVNTANVSGDASVDFDTMTYVDRFFGSNFGDTFTISSGFFGKNGSEFIEIRGGGGNDQITGHGNARISFIDATEAVTVDLGAGTGGSTSGNDAGVGNDTFSGVNAIRGSNFDDQLYGSNDPNTYDTKCQIL